MPPRVGMREKTFRTPVCHSDQREESLSCLPPLFVLFRSDPEERVMRHLPEMAIGIAEVAGVTTP